LHSGAVEKVLAGVEARAYKRWQRRKMAGVALLVALLGGVSWPLQRAVDENAADTQPITMMVSQPQRKMLPDGSIVELKDGANITIDYSSQIRLITLIGGTAHFQVVKNSGSPFIVRASGRHVRAVGTAFTVELDANEMTVLVTEGTVAVGEQVKEQRAASADSHARMVPSELVDAGHSIVFDLSAQRARLPIVRAVSQDELERRAAWRYPRLHFSGAALGEVVALLNRYNRIQLVIADPSLVGLKLSGALRASKVDALVQLLESDHQVKAEWRETEIVLRVAPAPTRNQ
jgi:transmembrane sensor